MCTVAGGEFWEVLFPQTLGQSSQKSKYAIPVITECLLILPEGMPVFNLHTTA